jgi:hypothetical protein
LQSDDFGPSQLAVCALAPRGASRLIAPDTTPNQSCFARAFSTLPDLRFASAVLLVLLRQDESLDSPVWLESAKAGLMMPLKSHHGSGKYLFAQDAPLNCEATIGEN